ncbi:hypothetical protein ACT3RM_10285, partial [Pseudoalteromonas sp. AOP7-A1-14]
MGQENTQKHTQRKYVKYSHDYRDRATCETNSYVLSSSSVYELMQVMPFTTGKNVYQGVKKYPSNLT